MSRPRILVNAVTCLLLLPLAAVLGLLELGTVARSECDYQSFEYICSDYEGAYGLASATVLLLWAGLMWVVNRRPKANRDVQ